MIPRVSLAHVALSRRALEKPGAAEAQSSSSWRQTLALGANLGVSSVEWSPALNEDDPLWSVGGRSELRDVARSLGLTICSVAAQNLTPPSVWVGSRGLTSAWVSQVSQVVSATADISAKQVVIELETLDDSLFSGVAVALQEVLPVARATSTQLTLHTKGHQEPLCQLLDRVNQPYVRAAYSPALAFRRLSDPAAELPALVRHLSMLRVSDATSQGDERCLGEGEVPYYQLLSLLGRVGFSGTLVLEPEATADPQLSVWRNLSYVRRQLSRTSIAEPLLEPARASSR